MVHLVHLSSHMLFQIVDIEHIEETGSLVMTCAGDTGEGEGLIDWIFKLSQFLLWLQNKEKLIISYLPSISAIVGISALSALSALS